jgi:hypothetical protein
MITLDATIVNVALGPLGIAVLGALPVTGRSPVSLHLAFVSTTGCYAVAIALARAGQRRARAVG